MAEETTHDRALVDAYRLLDQAQRSCYPVDIASALRLARRHRWSDVEFFLHYARYAQAELTGADMAGPLDHMERMAARAGDGALTAVVRACRAEQASAGLADVEPLGGDNGAGGLVAAVAMLAAGAGSPLHRPVAWIECALAYRSVGLWELEEELLASAAAALRAPWPSALAPLRDSTLRWVWIYRTEARASLVCETLELGDRALAAELARSTVVPLIASPDAAVVGSGPDEVVAVQSVLDAAAGRPDGGHVAPGRTDWAWSGYPSCGDLALAIRATVGDATTAPDMAAAADHAEAALAGMNQDYLPALRLLALALAGNRPPVSATARRYARELVELRVAARYRLLDRARTQLTRERLRWEHHAREDQVPVDQLIGS